MAEGSGADEAAAIFDAMFDGVSLQSLLLDHSLHHPFFSGGSALPPADGTAPAAALTLRLPKPEPLDVVSGEPIPDPHSRFLPERGARAAAAASARRRDLNKNNQLARERRRRISEKMRLLKRLMPWSRKTDTAAMLEEAYNYILYLEAQVAALYSMPAAHHSAGAPPLAQTVLYSQGQCVVTAEEAAGAAYQQQQQQTMMMLFGSSSSSVSNFY